MTDMEIFDALPPNVRSILRKTRFKYKASDIQVALGCTDMSEVIRQLITYDAQMARQMPSAVNLR